MNYRPAYGREEFFAAYSAFCESTDRIYQEILLIRKLPVDTYQLWAAVREQGGHEKVQLKKLWASTARRFNHPKSWTNASHYFKTTYEAAGLSHLEDIVDGGQFSIAEFAPGGALYNPHWRQHQHNNPLQQQQQLLAVALDPDRSVSDLDLQQQQQQQQQQQLDLGHPAAAVMYAQQQQEQQQQQGRLSSSSGGSSMTGVGSVVGLRLVVKCGTAHGLFDLARQCAICLCAQCSAASGGVGVEMMPTEFERHGGCGSFKKWKKSIMVEETGRNIGSWLTAHGLEILSPSALTKKAKRRQMAAEAAAAVAARGQQAGQQQQQRQRQQLMEAGSMGSLGDGVWQQQQQQVVQRSGSLAMHLPTAAAVALAAAMQGRTVQQQQRPFEGGSHDLVQYGDSVAQQQWQQQQQHGSMIRSAAAPLVQQQQQHGMPLHGFHNQQNAHSLQNSRDHIIKKESTWPGPNEQGYPKIHATPADLDQNHPDRPDHRDPRFSDPRFNDPRFCDQISSPAGFTYLDPNRVGSGGFSDSPKGPRAAATAAAAGGGLAARCESSQRLRDVAAAAALVGRQIKVWWPLDQEWYTATVQTYHPQQQLHSVIYDDGDVEQLNLLEEQWELLPDLRSDIRSPPDLRLDHGSDDPRSNPRSDPRSDQRAVPGGDPRESSVAKTHTGHSTAQAAEEGCVQNSPRSHQMAAAAAAAAPTSLPAAADSEVSQHTMMQHRKPLHGIKIQDTEAAAMHGREYDINNAPEGSPVVEVQQQQQQLSLGPAGAPIMERQQQGPGATQSNVSLRDLSDPDHPDLGRSDPDQETLDNQAAESAWLATAQQSVEDRPLRVIYDSHAGLIRIILAADLLDAELAMRRQQQQWLRQQQQHQRWSSRSGSDQTAAAAGRKRQRGDESVDVEHGRGQQESKRRSCSGQQQLHQAQQQQQQHHQQQPSRLPHVDRQVDLQRYKEVGNGYEVSYIPEPPGFEVLCLIPGYTIDQIRIKAWNDGRLLIKAVPDGREASMVSSTTAAGSGGADVLSGVPVERVIELPARISAQSAQAMMTDEGQLYVRVRTSC